MMNSSMNNDKLLDNIEDKDNIETKDLLKVIKETKSIQKSLKDKLDKIYSTIKEMDVQRASKEDPVETWEKLHKVDASS